jgi:hypothetical protein
MPRASHTIEIGALSIEVPARNPAHARALAAAIERRLRALPGLPLPAASMTIQRLRVDLPPWPPLASDAQIAAIVATGIHRALGTALRSASRPETIPDLSALPGAKPAGAPLPADTRRLMEWRLGHDFGQVRVHADGEASTLAAEMDARAVTIGDDIFLGSGQTLTDTDEGMRLLAHELTHVAQQRLGGAPASPQEREREARDAASGIASGRAPAIGQAAPAGAPQASPLDEDPGSDEGEEGENSVPDPLADVRRNDLPFPAEFDEAHPMPKLQRVVPPRGGRVRHAVRSDTRLTIALPASGPGFVFSGSPTQNRTMQEVVDAIVAVGALWNQLRLGDAEAKRRDRTVIVRPRIRVMAIGLVYGGPLPKNRKGPKGETLYHLSHDIGVDVDVGVVRRDGQEKASSYKEPSTYSRELTREAIDLFLSQKVLRVDRVFFDDPEIALPRNIVAPDRKTRHDDHFHVRFVVPPRKSP